MAASLPVAAQIPPTLVWITNSSVKVEQIIGDVDWATGLKTASQPISRFAPVLLRLAPPISTPLPAAVT